jgi:hypothetical protein
MTRALTLKIMFLVMTLFCVSCQPKFNIPDPLPGPDSLGEASQAFVRIKGVIGHLDVIHGSSFVFEDDGKDSYALTSDHICAFATNELRDMTFPSTIEKLMLLVGEDYNGNPLHIEIFARDTKNDVCILRLPNQVGLVKLNLSPTPPVIGEKYTTLSSPGGWAGKERVLIYDGYFSGKLLVPDKKLAYDVYTISASQGSSGSPIVAKDLSFVGVISMVASDQHNIMISSSYEATKMLIRSQLCTQGHFQTCLKINSADVKPSL